jgi:hypothetical protein
MICGIYHIDIIFRMMMGTGSDGKKYFGQQMRGWANFMRMVLMFFPHYVVCI